MASSEPVGSPRAGLLDPSRLPHAPNFRDLGGLPAEAGRQLRHGVLFRSGALSTLTAAEARYLRDELGVRTVLDLRTADEGAQSPSRELAAAGAAVHPLPLDRETTYAYEAWQGCASAGEFDVTDGYLGYLRNSGDTLAHGLRALSQPGALPAVVHCTLGKDRTGVFTALLLRCLGVDVDAVARDYARSQPAVPAVLASLAPDSDHHAAFRRLPAWATSAHPETVARLLARVEEDYGGVLGWAASVGVADATLQQLRGALLRPGQASTQDDRTPAE
ncbi:MAG: hypothetical protein GEV09_15640 [Pseudonocardiaceae bacterium]|nr:hypothetical protein [Pseudonocardiaceae bacterium]